MRTSEEVAAMSRCGFRSVRYLEVKNTWQKRFGTKDSVRCSEFRGGRFSEVANVLQVWDFQSVTRTLSALGSVSASRSVRSGRFYCISIFSSLSCSFTFLLGGSKSSSLSFTVMANF